MSQNFEIMSPSVVGDDLADDQHKEAIKIEFKNNESLRPSKKSSAHFLEGSGRLAHKSRSSIPVIKAVDSNEPQTASLALKKNNESFADGRPTGSELSRPGHSDTFHRTGGKGGYSQEEKFRFCAMATSYNFRHRPFEDKRVRQQHEREEKARRAGGLIGEPRNSAERVINKIFDHGRVKTRAANRCNGCDIDYMQREQHMAVGQVPRGGLKHLREEVAEERQHRLMNFDRGSVKEQLIAYTIENRGSTATAFDGDNHFHGLHEPKKKVLR